MSKLDAVNDVLALIGKHPTGALDTGGNSIPAHIERTLDRIDEEVQARGWHQNTETNVTATVDGSNNIVVDSDILDMDSDGADAFRNVTPRAGLLYDLDNNTSTFTDIDSMKVKQVRKLAFGDLTVKLRRYISALVAAEIHRQFNKPKDPNYSALLTMIENTISQRKAAAVKENDDRSNENMLTCDDARQVKGYRRRFPYRPI